MPFDYSKLDGRIVEICKTRSEFAIRMNFSERTLSLKMNEKVPWRQTDIVKACNILKIKYEDIPQYFFKLKVQVS